MGGMILAVSLATMPGVPLTSFFPNVERAEKFFQDAELVQRRFLAETKVMLVRAEKQLKDMDGIIEQLKANGYPQRLVDTSIRTREKQCDHIKLLQQSIARSERFLHDWSTRRP